MQGTKHLMVSKRQTWSYERNHTNKNKGAILTWAMERCVTPELWKVLIYVVHVIWVNGGENRKEGAQADLEICKPLLSNQGEQVSRENKRKPEKGGIQDINIIETRMGSFKQAGHG